MQIRNTFKGKLPLLAVCYGAQYLSHFYGGSVKPSDLREYGRANLSHVKSNETFPSLIYIFDLNSS